MAGLEDEFELDKENEDLINNMAGVSASVNMMKQLSESFMEDSKKAELSLKTGDSVDRHMDLDAVTETMNHLE